MIGTDYTRDDIVQTVQTVAGARAWSADQLAEALVALEDLPGWREWIDLDGEVDADWYPAAAAWARASGLPGGEELAVLWEQAAGIESAERGRAIELAAAPVVMVGENVADLATDVAVPIGQTAIGAVRAAESATATARRNPVPVLLGLGALLGLGLYLRSRL